MARFEQTESMIQGLYKVSFQANGSSGDGVVVIDNGQFVGGDSCLYYFGTFQEQGDVVTVVLQTHRHSEGPESLLGNDDFSATLSGTVTATGFTMANDPLVITGVPLSLA